MFFFSGRPRKQETYLDALYVKRGFHGVFANAVENFSQRILQSENLVFLKPFAIHKTLCKHFARVQIILVMCISDYLFYRRGLLVPYKKRKKENILCNLTSTKNQNESKQLCTCSLQCCFTIVNVCTRQLARGLMLI